MNYAKQDRNDEIFESLTDYQQRAVLAATDALTNAAEDAHAAWIDELEAAYPGQAWWRLIEAPEGRGAPGSQLRTAFDNLEACNAAVRRATVAAMRRQMFAVVR